ncbi:MAG: NAD(+) synthase [Flavobacterium sp.]
MANNTTIDTGRVTKHITEWLKDYASEAKVAGFVVGISGGIDSAVVSTLCARTGMKTLCVQMPIHQAESELSRAADQIQFLKENFENVSETTTDLTDAFETFSSLFDSAESPTKALTLANTRARLRMTALYYHAGINGLLVAGTGNKIEDFGVGFFTKYGDGGVDISPIADLLKSEVYALASYLNLPSTLQNAVPTDGLFGDSRTDEQQLGASYDELEWAMKNVNSNEEGFSLREQEVLKIYKRLNKINQHKINPIPVCKIPSELYY